MAAKKTPLYEKHISYGGEVVDYAGWLLPVKYEGLAAEHNAVRNNAGFLCGRAHQNAQMANGRRRNALYN